MDREPKLPEPTIEAEKVAEAILEAAKTPTRITRLGMGAKLNTAMAKLAPALADELAKRIADQVQYDEPPRHPAGALHHASATTSVVGQTHGTGGRRRAS